MLKENERVAVRAVQVAVHTHVQPVSERVLPRGQRGEHRNDGECGLHVSSLSLPFESSHASCSWRFGFVADDVANLAVRLVLDGQADARDLLSLHNASHTVRKAIRASATDACKGEDVYNSMKS